MAYIVHPRKIIVIQEPVPSGFAHFTDRYGRFVIYSIPTELPEAKDLVENVFNGNKDQNTLIARLSIITMITNLNIVFTGVGSHSRCIRTGEKHATYMRHWKNLIISVQEGDVDISDEDELLYLGWENEHTENFIRDQFKYDPKVGESVNFRVIESGLQNLRQMDAVRAHTEIDRPVQEPQTFDASVDFTPPFDLVTDDDKN